MNSFYYHYFLRKNGLIVPDNEEDHDNVVLDYMTSPDSVCQSAADTLRISPLWLTSVPVVFSKKTFALYLLSGDQVAGLTPTKEGILFKSPSPFLVKALGKILDGSFEPVETPTPMPYALIRAAAKRDQLSVEKYFKDNFEYKDTTVAEEAIRNIVHAGLIIPAGDMTEADHGIIRNFAEIEDLSMEEAVSGFELRDENCLANLLLAFRLFVSRFVADYKKDGSILISYPGYKMSAFASVIPVSDSYHYDMDIEEAIVSDC